MPAGPPIKQRGADVVLDVRVQPKSSRNAVRLGSDGVVRIWTTAPPEDGKANEAVVRHLAKIASVARSRVAIESGETSRYKRIVIHDVDARSVTRVIELESDQEQVT